ncbi:MAG: cache domain-containing protein, partial [Pseudomonadota bacterium]
MGTKLTLGMRPDRLALLAGAFLALLAGILALPRVEGALFRQSIAEGNATLRLVSEGLTATIGRYDPLPGLIAERPILTELLKDPANAGLLPFVNEQLRQTALSVGASDVYLMDATGMTIAASSYRNARSFVGRSFHFRPYFQDAMQGRPARFHALGTTSGERGFFFAAPVIDQSEIIGVVAVKFTVDRVEEAWAELGPDVLLADGNGVIFISSRPDWRFRTLAPLPPGVRDQIAKTRQFPLEYLTEVEASAQLLGQGVVTLRIGGTGAKDTFLARSMPGGL